jgi:hypothetical protein
MQFWIGSRMQTELEISASVQTGELAALRKARSLRVLEQLYFDGNPGKRNSGKMVA